MIRAVLDANVFVSAILSPKGIPAKVLTAWRTEQFHLVLSEAILENLAHVLHYPRIARRHRWSEERLQAFIENLAHLAIMTLGAAHLAVIAEDPPDDRYLTKKLTVCAHNGSPYPVPPNSGREGLRRELSGHKDLEQLRCQGRSSGSHGVTGSNPVSSTNFS